MRKVVFGGSGPKGGGITVYTDGREGLLYIQMYGCLMQLSTILVPRKKLSMFLLILPILIFSAYPKLFIAIDGHAPLKSDL
jgi:hypothetical protein